MTVRLVKFYMSWVNILEREVSFYLQVYFYSNSALCTQGSGLGNLWFFSSIFILLVVNV